MEKCGYMGYDLRITFTKGADCMAMEYMTTAQAAAYTSISQAKLEKLRYTGRGSRYIRLGTSPTKAIVRYRKADLDEWLSENLVVTTGGL